MIVNIKKDKSIPSVKQHLKDGDFHSKMEGGLKKMVKSPYSDKRAFLKILLPTFFSFRAINESCKF